MDTNERTDDGVLDSTFRTDGPDVDDGAAGDEPAPEATAAPEGQAQKVPVGRPPSRRQQEFERVLGEIKADREAREVRDREYKENLETIRRENAELRGFIQARPAQQEQRRDETPDHEKLQEEAIAALDKNDFRTYQRKTIEAAVAQARANAPQQQAPQQQTNPMLLATMAQYPDVMGNPEAFEIMQAHNRILHNKGVPDGPERWRQAMEAGRKHIGGNKQNGAPGFSQRNRDVVAGVPSSGTGGSRSGGGGEPGVILTAEERATAKKYKMTEQDYAKEMAVMHPERIVK